MFVTDLFVYLFFSRGLERELPLLLPFSVDLCLNILLFVVRVYWLACRHLVELSLQPKPFGCVMADLTVNGVDVMCVEELRDTAQVGGWIDNSVSGRVSRGWPVFLFGPEAIPDSQYELLLLLLLLLDLPSQTSFPRVRLSWLTP